jgi:hypothetical protein
MHCDLRALYTIMFLSFALRLQLGFKYTLLRMLRLASFLIQYSELLALRHVHPAAFLEIDTILGRICELLARNSSTKSGCMIRVLLAHCVSEAYEQA